LKEKINVIKRDGRVEPFNIDKIYGFLEYASNELNVDKTSIMKKFMENIKDGMTTEQIHQTLIMIIVLDIDIDAVDNAVLAGRLFLYDLRHQVTKTLGGLSFRKYIEYGVEHGIFDKVLLSYDLDRLAKAIKHDRDDQFSYVGAYTFRQRYIKSVNEEPFELPQFVFMSVAMVLMQNEPDGLKEHYAEQHYSEVSQFNFMHSTPTLANARSIRCQLNSCYGGVTHDSAEGIMHSRTVMAILSKFGGGIGWSDGFVRTDGSVVDGIPGASGGVVPLAVTTNAIQLEFDQLGCVSSNSRIAIIDTITVDGVTYNVREEKYYVKYSDARDNYVSDIVSEILDENDENYNEKMLKIEKYLCGRSIDADVPELANAINGRYLPKGFTDIKVKGLEDYMINEFGLMINRYTLATVPAKLSKGGKVLTASIDEKKYYIATVMALTYLGYEKGLVYHKDNNTHNVNLKNLTIVTEKIDINNADKPTIEELINIVNAMDDIESAITYIPLYHSEIEPGMLALSLNNETGKKEVRKLVSKHTVRVPSLAQTEITTTLGSYTTSAWHPTPIVENSNIVYKRADEVVEGEVTISNLGEEKVIFTVGGDSDEVFVDYTIEHNNNYFVHVGVDEGKDRYLLTHNTRKGAIAVYLEPWNKDFKEFLELHKPTGDVRRRAYDMNIAMWENKLFMERVRNNETWTLFDPHDVTDLLDLYGDEFKERYEHYERSSSISKEVVKAADLYTSIMSIALTSGEPYCVDKDEMNRRHMNKHLGTIYSSNLCCEISQYAKAGELYTYVYDREGKLLGKELGSDISESGRPYSKLAPNDFYKGVNIGYTENKIEDDEIFVCTLASLNISKINTEEDIKRVVPIMIRALDNIIDINYYPVGGAFRHAMKTRAIGLGVMGEHHLLAKEGLEFGSKEALQRIDQIMEWVSYYAYQASADLAVEKGVAPGFKGSEWEKGVLPVDFANENIKKIVDRPWSMDWDQLREKTSKGMRNLYVMAVAPTTNIAVITNTTPSIEPIFKRVYTDKTSVGEFRSVVPDLNINTIKFYKSAYEIDQMKVIQNLAVVQQWIDQAPSGNLFPDTGISNSTRDLGILYHYARHLGVSSIYYARGKSPEEIDELTQDDFVTCSGCQ